MGTSGKRERRMNVPNRFTLSFTVLVVVLAVGVGTTISQDAAPQGAGSTIPLGPVLESDELRGLLDNGFSDAERERVVGLVFGVGRSSEFVTGFGAQLVGQNVADARVLTKIEFDDYYSVILLSSKDDNGDRRVIDIVGSSWDADGQHVENPWVLIDGEEVQNMYAVVRYGTARTPRIEKIFTVDLLQERIVDLDFDPSAIEVLPEE